MDDHDRDFIGEEIAVRESKRDEAENCLSSARIVLLVAIMLVLLLLVFACISASRAGEY